MGWAIERTHAYAVLLGVRMTQRRRAVRSLSRVPVSVYTYYYDVNLLLREYGLELELEILQEGHGITTEPQGTF
jgi:hypothetical protein